MLAYKASIHPSSYTTNLLVLFAERYYKGTINNINDDFEEAEILNKKFLNVLYYIKILITYLMQCNVNDSVFPFLNPIKLFFGCYTSKG